MIFRVKYRTQSKELGENGILKKLTKALVESALGAELTVHLGYDNHVIGEMARGNRRNGESKKTVHNEQGPIEIDVPRDRETSFNPRLVAKHQG